MDYFLKVDVRNPKNDKIITLELPMDEDDLKDNLRTSLGADLDNEASQYEKLMSGQPIDEYVINKYGEDIEFITKLLTDSNNLNNPGDILEINELLSRLNDLEIYEIDLLNALMESGDYLYDALDTVESGDVTFYEDRTISEVAEELVGDGYFDKDFLMSYIDYDALGNYLSENGFTEVSNGVVERH